MRCFSKDYVFGEYVNHARQSIAISSLPDGDAFYQACLDFHTYPGLTAEEIHNIGLEEVKQLKEGVLALAESMGEDKYITFKEFVAKSERLDRKKSD